MTAFLLGDTTSHVDRRVLSTYADPVKISCMPLEPLPIGVQDDTYERGGPFFVMSEHRRKHMAIFGSTGAGKSTLLRNMIACDIASGIGLTVVDPHGDLIEDILENHIPRHRTNDVVYF